MSVSSLLRLADFRAAFGENAGVLPDGRVLESVRAEWSSVLGLAAAQEWSLNWSADGRKVAASDLGVESRDAQSFALRPVSGVQINWFLGDEIVFDIDLREYTDQAALDALCDVIARLGSALDKPVVLSAEGDWDDEVIRFEPDSGQFALGKSRWA
jgi:hypothetical protein